MNHNSRRKTSPGFILLVLVVLISCNAPNVYCDDAAGAQQKPSPLEIKATGENQVGLRHSITIRVVNLDKWISEPGHDASKFVLFLDGNEFKGLVPTVVDSPEPDPKDPKTLV